MLIPKKVKHRKWHKIAGSTTSVATRSTTLAFGQYGLKALSEAWVTSRQIEATRRVLTRFTKKTGRIWIRIFPDKPVTKKGDQSVMGSGKGAVDHYVRAVVPGMILFEMDGISDTDAREAMRSAGHKLPVKTKFVRKDVFTN